MEALGKLERKLLEWTKKVPHLPAAARSWLGENVWWIVLVGAIIMAISSLFALIGLVGTLSVVGTIAATYYAASAFTGWAILTGIVGLVFIVLEAFLLFMAVKPLQARQKKGWVLLFAYWLLGAVSVVVNAVLSLNVFAFIVTILFGAVWLAIAGYFLLEIHGQFAHVEKSRGVKAHETKAHES